MRCYKCNGKLKLQKRPYHYLESGLSNIFLKNIKWWKCLHCKGTEVEIPRVAQLHRCIAWSIVTQHSLLTGPEIVFLRKQLQLSQKEMAETIGVRQPVFNRWETEARKGHSKANDRLLRIVYLLTQNDEYTHEINVELRKKLLKQLAQINGRDEAIKKQIDPNRCEPQEIIQSSLAIPSQRINHRHSACYQF
jgi:putative transcriptional regulator